MQMKAHGERHLAGKTPTSYLAKLLNDLRLKYPVKQTDNNIYFSVFKFFNQY